MPLPERSKNHDPGTGKWQLTHLSAIKLSVCAYPPLRLSGLTARIPIAGGEAHMNWQAELRRGSLISPP